MKSASKSLPIHEATRFTWVKNEGSAEMSGFNETQVSGQVWADACDVGFKVRSPRTGKIVIFVFEEWVQLKTRGGKEVTSAMSLEEIVGALYVSEDRKFRIMIFND